MIGRFASGQPLLRFTGDASSSGFALVDHKVRQEFLTWKQLELKGLDYAMAPDSLTIDRVLVRQPYARVIISPEQVINIAAVLDRFTGVIDGAYSGWADDLQVYDRALADEQVEALFPRVHEGDGVPGAGQHALEQQARPMEEHLLRGEDLATQGRLADGLDLHSQIKVAHWNIKGPHFATLHPLFETFAVTVIATMLIGGFFFKNGFSTSIRSGFPISCSS